MTYKLGFKEFEKRIKHIAKQIKSNPEIKNIFGIPRGGLIPAVRLSHLTGLPLAPNPDDIHTAVIDDCIESDAKLHAFTNFRYFFAVINKDEDKIDDWIEFWWEEK